MPIAPTYPGVYIEEVPSGVRPIVGVSTAVAAFVDRFPRGPIRTPVRVFSVADVEREFGAVDAGSAASYGLRQFFLNGGTEAYVVRIETAGSAAAATILTGDGANVVGVTAGRQVRGVPIEDHGEWGSRLRVEIDYGTVELPNASVDPSNVLTQGELFNLTVLETDVQNGKLVVRQTETFRNLTMREGARTNALRVVNDGSKLLQLSPEDDVPDPPFRPDATGTLSGELPEPAFLPGDRAEIAVTVSPGGLAPDLTAVATIRYGGQAPTEYASLRPHLERAIRTAVPNNPGDAPDLGPLLRDATVQLAHNRFRFLLGRPVSFQSDAVIRFGEVAGDTTATDLLLTAAAGATENVQLVAFTGTPGADGAAPTDAELRGSRAGKTGIYALEDVDLFNILCIPAAADLGSARSVYEEAERYCEDRRAFLIIDIPKAVKQVTDMEAWVEVNAGLRHRNAAVYFPRLLVPDANDQNRARDMPTSGIIAGLYASTDGARGVWKAPAGIDARLRGVEGVAHSLTDPENGVLNPQGVNCLRNFPVFGPVAWGARTLDGADVQASDWKYIPVRRFALFLEESLYRGTKWAVFEPNDEPLWAQLRLNIGAFMQSLFRQGAFQGKTPREAYLVKCDRETTTQDDINRGIVNILVGFAPLKPAEFVFIRIQQLAGQVET